MFKIEKTNLFEEWFSSLRDGEARMRIVARIKRAELGNLGDIKPVGNGVSEMRIHYGAGYRVYFVERKGKLIILLAGGDKRTQKRDILNVLILAKEV